MHHSKVQSWRAQFEELKKFLRKMHGEFGPDDGLQEDALHDKRIPLPLKEFYRFGGNRLKGSHSIIIYNKIPMPWELDWSNDEVIFYIWGGRFHVWASVGLDENPPVIRINKNGTRVYEQERLCGFLYQICLFETCAFSKYTIHCSVTCDDIHDVLAPWIKFPFTPRPMHDDDSFPNMFFYAKNAIGFLCRVKTNCTFICGAKKAEDLAFMKPVRQKMRFGDWIFLKDAESCQEANFW